MKMYEFDGELFEDIEDLMIHLGAELAYEQTCMRCPVCGSRHFDVDGEPLDTILLDNGKSICDDDACLLKYYDVKIVEVEEADMNEELDREFNKERL